MSQKSKSSGKSSKAAKPAKAKAVVKAKPKAPETNHKASAKASPKTAKVKPPLSNGHAEEQEPPSAAVMLLFEIARDVAQDFGPHGDHVRRLGDDAHGLRSGCLLLLHRERR